MAVRSTADTTRTSVSSGKSSQAAPPASMKISPTAYATGYLWYRHGLSHPALLPPQGRRMDWTFRVVAGGIRALTGVSLEAMLLARHKGIDGQLADAIEDGRVRQIIELAAGISPRGWDLMRRYGDRLVYVETDLPAMAAIKRQMLATAGFLSERHRVAALDALAHAGPQSLAAVAATLDPAQGTALITEGLMNYLGPALARATWKRIATALSGFSYGLYLSDAYVARGNRDTAIRCFATVISRVVRGRVQAHFETPEDALTILRTAGFRTVVAHETRHLPATRALSNIRGAERVRVLEATA